MRNADMPAMPLTLNPGEVAADGVNVDGLTKREHFAAMAMQGLLASGKYPVDDDMVSEAWIAADCMLNSGESTS